MSGGLFNYTDSALKDEIFGYSDKPTNVFEDREVSELIWDVFDLINAFDYFKSGDTCKETYLAKKQEFKKKWFSKRGVRIKRIIDDAINELRNDLYETFGMEVKSDEND